MCEEEGHTAKEPTTLLIIIYLFFVINHVWLIYRFKRLADRSRHHILWSGQEGCSGSELDASSAI